MPWTLYDRLSLIMALALATIPIAIGTALLMGRGSPDLMLLVPIAAGAAGLLSAGAIRGRGPGRFGGAVTSLVTALGVLAIGMGLILQRLT